MNAIKLCTCILLAACSFLTHAAITFVDSDLDSGNDSDANLTIPAGTQTGDLLLVHLAYRDRNGSDDNTAPAGWTAIGGLQNESELFQQLYYRVAVAGDASTNTNWDFDGNGNRRFVASLSSYRGVDTSNPIDASSAWANRMFFNSVTAPSVTTSSANAMLVAFYSVEAGNDSFSQGAGLTEVYDRETGSSGNGITASSAYVVQASAGASGDKNATVNNATVDDAIGQLVALNEGSVSFPTIQSAGGACGADNLIVVQFNSTIGDSALNPALFTLNGATVDAVTRQADDILVLSVSGFVGGQAYQLTFDGNDTGVDFQGVLGRYFDQRSGAGDSKVSWNNGGLFTGNEFLRLDSQINFTWNSGTPTVFPSVSGNNERFSIRWTGYIQPTVTGSYEFRLYSDDGVRLDLDGNQIIDDWSLHGPRYSSISAAQALNAGGVYQIQMEHFEHTGLAVARLEWRRDSGSWEAVPNANLNTCPVVITAPVPELEYWFDETSWSGAADEVQDQSASNSNGVAQGGLSTTSDGHLCRAGQFDGVNDYIELGAGTLDDLRGTSSLSFWLKTTQTGNNTGWMAPGVAGIEESGGSDDIFWGWLDASGHIGLSVGNAYSTKSSIAINDNTYHHVVLTRDATAGAYKIYIDGVLDVSGAIATGTIGNGFSSLGRIEDTGGTPEYLQGNLDEVKVFSSVLSDAEVTSLFNETRACNTNLPVAFYTFEQDPWNTAGTVIADESGNNNDAVSLGNAADNAAGYVCRGADIPDNNSLAQIDAINSQQDINTSMGNEGTIMLWYRAESNWIGSGNRTLIDASSRVFNNSVDKYFFLSKQNDGRLRLGMEDSADRDFNVYTSAQNVTAGDWVNVAIVWDFPNDLAQIYVNGTREANQSINTNGVLGDLGPVYIGDNSSSYNVAPGSSAHGRVDEVRFYTEVLDATEIGVAMAESHPCSSSCTLGSFAIAQPDYGLACPNARAEITITAMCSDGVTTKTDYSGTVALSSNENASSSFYAASTGGSAITDTVFDGSENGQKSVYLFHDNVNTSLLVTADDSTVSTTSSDSTQFGVMGFVATNPGNFTCGNSTSVTLTAIGQDTSSGGNCVQLTNFTGNKNLKAWSQINIDVAESPGVADAGLPNSIEVNGSSIGDSQPATANASANFVNGVGTLNIEYGDVGEVLSLNIRHDDAPYDGSVVEFSPLLASLSSFIVSPDQVDVQASDTVNSACVGATEAALGNCSRFTAAGSDFSINTRALCSDASLAQSYRGTVNLTHQLIAPSAGTAGSLNVNSVTFDGTETTAGQRTTSNQQFSEVGVFTLTSSPTNYFGQGVSGAVSNNIGRFSPDHFEVSVSGGSFTDACGSFTYLGQDFGYDAGALPNATITARNANNVTTQNYTDVNFNKLTSSNVARVFPNADNSQFGADGATLMPVSTATNLGSLSVLSPGNLFYEFNAADTYAYDKDANALVVPFTAALTITGSVSDDDGVSASSAPSWTPTGLVQRYGRWRTENVFGPETESLSMLGQTEFYNASAEFVLNTDDSCTVVDTGLGITDSGGNAVSSPYSNIAVEDGSSALTYNTTVVNGSGGFSFSAPGVASAGDEHFGSIGLTLDLSTQDWLRFNWDASLDGSLEDAPAKSATFGQYRGHDRIIYWREVEL